MDANTLRRMNWLWKHRHTHTGDELDDITDRLIVVETHLDGVVPGVNSGARIHLESTDAQAVSDSTPTKVEYDSLNPLGSNGFPAHTFPADEVQFTQPGYYYVEFGHTWASPVGGKVELVRTRGGESVVVWPSAAQDWDATFPAYEFEGVAVVPAQPGDSLAVQVTQTSGGAVNIASAYLVAGLMEPEVGVASGGFDIASTKAGPQTTGVASPISVPLPTNIVGDRLFIAVVTSATNDGPEIITPDDWSSIEDYEGSVARLTILTIVSPGGLTSVDVTTFTSQSTSAIAWRVRSPYASLTPDSAITGNSQTAPAVTPSHGSGRYAVFSIAGGRNYWDISGPSGFAELEDVVLTDLSGSNSFLYTAVDVRTLSGTVTPGGMAAAGDQGSGRNWHSATVVCKVGDLG